ncbi:glycosyltransferase [Streptomyces sp. N35]|uniref:glycosyltransferase n=1 Tax=Streptomyces sp. N35 TaxID=2795730 RepID=UPI001F2CE2DB|nr:glycosyltransferase [Streptomyces sp. N35]
MAPRKPTLCLCMIVKNEAQVIERCLASVRDLIDTWCICDTGSTDVTQELIRTALDGIPGELREEPWQDFGHNRSLNLRHAYGKADYLLLVDADMVVRQDAPLPPLGSDAYLLKHAGESEYRIKRLVRGDVRWHYVGATHEYLTSHQDHRQENLDALVIEHFADGGSRADKFERDAGLLRRELARDPGNTRTVFYLAQTLRDLGEHEESVALYERRARMGGWAEEVYFSLLQAGVQRADHGDWPGGMDCLVRAWESRPERLEALYELTSRLRLKEQYRAAHSFASAGIDRPRPQDDLFVQPWVYRWGMLFEYSITAYWTGDATASVAACDRLLAMADLPDAYRHQVLVNRQFGLTLVPQSRTVRIPQPIW